MHACGICEKGEGVQAEEVGTAQYSGRSLGRVKQRTQHCKDAS